MIFGKKISRVKGFTLIELLVVIAIIAILSSLVLSSLSAARARGRDTKRAADLKQLQQAVENYFENNSAYPSTLDSLSPTYITTAPRDPLGNQYCYTPTAAPAPAYCIGALFETGVPGTLPPSSSCTITGSSCNPSQYNYKLGGP